MMENWEQWKVDHVANLMWGRDAVEAVEAVEAVAEELDDDGNVVVEAVEGVEGVEAVEAIEGAEQKWRKGDKALNEAYVAMQQAEKAISQNQDMQAVYDLINTLRDAQELVDDKQLKIDRINEYYHLLHMEFERLNNARDEVL